MIIRTIDKQILLTLVSNYNWDPIPREVIDHWVKMHGKNITIESEETEETEVTEVTTEATQAAEAVTEASAEPKE